MSAKYQVGEMFKIWRIDPNVELEFQMLTFDKSVECWKIKCSKVGKRSQCWKLFAMFIGSKCWNLSFGELMKILKCQWKVSYERKCRTLSHKLGIHQNSEIEQIDHIVDTWVE